MAVPSGPTGPAAQQIIFTIGGKNQTILCQMIAATAIRYGPNKWYMQYCQPPVDVPAPTGVRVMPGQPPSVVYDSSSAPSKLVTVTRTQQMGRMSTAYNAQYYAELTFRSGFPSVTAGLQLPSTSYVPTSLLVHNQSVSVLSQKIDVNSSKLTVTQPTLPSLDDAAASEGSETAANPPAMPWTTLSFNSNHASPSPVKNPFARASFVQFDSETNSTADDVIVIETRINSAELVPNDQNPPDYSFNAYSMPWSSFDNIQTRGELLWSEYTINATAPVPDPGPQIILSNPAPLVVPVAGQNTGQLLYIFYSQPGDNIPFYYFRVPLSDTYSLIADGNNTITATPQTSKPGPAWKLSRGALQQVITLTQLPSVIDSNASEPKWILQAPAPVIIGMGGTDGPSAVFVFFLVSFQQGQQAVQTGIAWVSQELPADGILDPTQWVYQGEMIPLELQDKVPNTPSLFSAVTVPVSNNWFPGQGNWGFTPIIPPYFYPPPT